MIARRDVYRDIRSDLVLRLFPDTPLVAYPRGDSSLFVSPDHSRVVWAGGGRSLFLGLNKKFMPVIAAATSACAVIYALTDAGMSVFAVPLAVKDGILLLGKRPIHDPGKDNKNYLMHLIRDASFNWKIKENGLPLRTFNATELAFVSGHWRRIKIQPVTPPPEPATLAVIQALNDLGKDHYDPYWRIEVRAVPMESTP
jgi:hypothetical protein